MPYKDGEVQIIKVDPFHPVIGMLFPLLAIRVLEMARSHFAEMNPEGLARECLAKVVAGDPDVILLGFVAPDGRLIGHSLGFIQGAYGKRWLFVLQSKVDEPAGDLVSRAILFAKVFAEERGAGMVIFETKRSDSAWTRAIGARTLRHLMCIPMNGHVEAGPAPVEKDA